MYFYRKRDNLVYTLNPLAVSLFCLAAALLSLTAAHPFYPAAVFLAVVLVTRASGNGKILREYLNYSFFLFFLIILINVVFSPGGHTVLASFKAGGKAWDFTLEALVYGLAMGIRLLAVVAVFCFFNCVVDPDWFFDFFSFKNGRFAVLGNLTLRLFPLTVHDFRRTAQVQALRGLNFEEGSLKEKVKKGGMLLNSVLLSSLERSLQMAEAMYVKGYGAGERSCYYNYRWRMRDYIVLGAVLASVLLNLFGFYKGFMGYRFYPELDMIEPGDILRAGLVFFLFSLPAWLKWGADRWKRLRWII